MKVVVDTSIWSKVLRRRKRGVSRHAEELRELIDEGRVALLGPVRQELLSGVKTQTQFDQLRDTMRAFPDIQLETEDFEEAALAFTACRAKGIQGSNTDLLICAVAIRREYEVFTSDEDFTHFQHALKDLSLYEPRFTED
ncbi:MAG: PIN domain-containing protein [Myxococcota bacterium]